MKKNQISLSILLTGGAGFLGSAIVKELFSANSPVAVERLVIFDSKTYKGPADKRIEVVTADIRDEQAVLSACTGMDAVIHTAAIVDWGTRPASEVYAVNYTGTGNVIRACRSAGVKYLIYTSSLDAIYTGRSMSNLDESVPYPVNHPNMYCRSKALAEMDVLAANSGSLQTCVLRPADVYGPADPFHIESLINMSKGGFYVRLGNGKSLSQHVFVGNMALAHLQALAALHGGNTTPAGNVYFITDGPAVNFFRFFDAIVEGAGYRIWPKDLWIPRNLAMVIGFLAELSALLVRPFVKFNPKFSRFAVLYTCNDFTFTAEKATRDFGFRPEYSSRESFQRTIEYYANEPSRQQA